MFGDLCTFIKLLIWQLIKYSWADIYCTLSRTHKCSTADKKLGFHCVRQKRKNPGKSFLHHTKWKSKFTFFYTFDNEWKWTNIIWTQLSNNSECFEKLCNLQVVYNQFYQPFQKWLFNIFNPIFWFAIKAIINLYVPYANPQKQFKLKVSPWKVTDNLVRKSVSEVKASRRQSKKAGENHPNPLNSGMGSGSTVEEKW